MKQKKENRVALLLHWAGEQKILAVPGNPAVHVQRALHYCPVYWDLQADGCHI